MTAPFNRSGTPPGRLIVGGVFLCWMGLLAHERRRRCRRGRGTGRGAPRSRMGTESLFGPPRERAKPDPSGERESPRDEASMEQARSYATPRDSLPEAKRAPESERGRADFSTRPVSRWEDQPQTSNPQWNLRRSGVLSFTPSVAASSPATVTLSLARRLDLTLLSARFAF
jgi:hypothetical protein